MADDDPETTFARLRADLAPLGDPYSLVLVAAPGGGMQGGSEVAHRLGLRIPAFLDVAISVRVDGREKMLLPFRSRSAQRRSGSRGSAPAPIASSPGSASSVDARRGHQTAHASLLSDSSSTSSPSNTCPVCAKP